jgi:hypothetical protein
MTSMWAFSFLGCFGPLVILGLAAVCIRSLWLALATPSKVPTEPSCGRCGYSVTGLTTPECPECGADLRIVGINTRALALKHRGGLGGAILAWTILWGSAGFVFLSFGAVFLIRPMAQSVAATPQTWSTPMYPNSKAYASVSLIQQMAFGGPGKPSGTTLDLALADGSVWKMAVNGPTKSYTITDPAGTPVTAGANYVPGSTAAFFKAAGLDPTDPRIGAEAAELRSVVDVVLLSPFTRPSQMNLSEFTAGSPAFSGGPAMMAAARSPFADPGMIALLIGAPLAWLLIYGTGIWLIVRRRRRLLAMCGA